MEKAEKAEPGKEKEQAMERDRTVCPGFAEQWRGEAGTPAAINRQSPGCNVRIKGPDLCGREVVMEANGKNAIIASGIKTTVKLGG